jgi:hypothetical protein
VRMIVVVVIVVLHRMAVRPWVAWRRNLAEALRIAYRAHDRRRTVI